MLKTEGWGEGVGAIRPSLGAGARMALPPWTQS